jgi:hypothetical protein
MLYIASAQAAMKSGIPHKSDRWSSAGAAEDMVSRAEPSHLARNQLGPAIHEPLMFLRK